MIDKATAVDAVMERLEKLPVGHCLDLRTYKRNRSVLLIKTGPGHYRAVEDGFHAETFEVAESKVRKLLAKLLKREFPRSNKIRLYSLGEYSEAIQSLPRKKL